MKRSSKIAILVAALAATISCAHAGPHAIPLRIVCTVPTEFDPQRCWVEFGEPVTGQRVEVASQADGEELIAILLANSGRRYVIDGGVPPMSLPLPATLQLKRPPLKRGPADKR